MRKILVIVLAVLLCVSVAVHLIRFRQVRVAKDTLDSQRLRNESLLAEKLGIEKSTDKLKQEMKSIIAANALAKIELAKISDANLVKETQLERFIAERRKMSYTNELLQKQIDSLARQMIAREYEVIDEKRKLEDSIRYLIEFSEALSAELNGKLNQ